MRFILIIIFLIAPLLVKSQTVCTAESKERLDAYLLKLSEMDLSEKSPNERIIEIGQWFLHTPYVEKTLELPGEEKLVINLMGLDCTTYLETVVNLARLAQIG